MDNENKSEVIEQTGNEEPAAEVENGTPTVESEDDWDDITWDDIEEPKDDNGDNEETDDNEETEQNEDAHEDEGEAEDQWLELKHMDDPVRKVSKEEAKQLALKGLDYDRIREDRDSMRNDLPRYKEMEKFLDELKGEFGSVEELMDDTRARVLMQSDDSLSYEDAVEKAKSSRTSKSTKQTNPSNTSTPVDEFVKKYPKVKAEEIPESVWAEVRETGDLVGAYSNYINSKKDYEIKQLRDEIEILKKNNKNAARSTGSRKTAGNNKNTLFDDLWNDGT